MLKPFFVLVTLLVFMAGGVSIHYLLHPHGPENTMISLVKLTGLVSPSLSVTYYEPRILFFEEAVNPAYPQMQPINKMDLVYAR
jgi:hypothetical protein